MTGEPKRCSGYRCQFSFVDVKNDHIFRCLKQCKFIISQFSRAELWQRSQQVKIKMSLPGSIHLLAELSSMHLLNWGPQVLIELRSPGPFWLSCRGHSHLLEATCTLWLMTPFIFKARNGQSTLLILWLSLTPPLKQPSPVILLWWYHSVLSQGWLIFFHYRSSGFLN